MSEIKVDEVWRSDGDSVMTVTAIGKDHLLAYSEDSGDELKFSKELWFRCWTKTHEADGEKVEEQGLEEAPAAEIRELANAIIKIAEKAQRSKV